MSQRYPGGLIIKNPVAPTASAAPGIWTLDQAIQYIKSGNWPLPPQPDPYFNQTTLLLHGDGTNGAQNNTFLDSSTNNFTLTRNGNTTQGTFSPFSLAAGQWSNFFDGTGDYLSWSGTTLAADFTVECWVYKTAVDASGYTNVFSTTAANTQFAIDNTTAGSISLVIGASVIITASGTAVTTNEWHHLAWVREGSTCRAYVDGVQQGTGTSATAVSLNLIGKFQTTGYEMNGYISNARIIAGTCLYPSGTTFTPPTAPLTAVSGTELLTCQSNRFVDNSSNAFAITVTGNTSVQPFSPFAPTAAYSPTTNGGSGYFDGSGDYLSVANNAALNVLGGSFTIECWFYLTEPQADAGLISKHSPGYILRLDTTFIRFYTSAATVDRTYSFAQNTWYHVAVVSNGTTGTLYVNGVAQGATFSTNGTNATTDLQIGRTNTVTNDFGGYITNVRITNTVVYSSDFTPPTSPPTAISGTAFLCNFTNAGILDNTGKNNLETVGNAQIDTTTKKYGTGSMEFDGTGDYLVAPSSPNTTLSGDFTVEGWIYITTLGNNFLLFGIGNDATSTGISLFVNSAGRPRVLTNNAYAAEGSDGDVSAATWTHVALVRSGSTITIYIDGSSVDTGTVSATLSGILYVGAENYSGTVYPTIAGFIDDLRITKGVARYTTTFTPPTRAFPNF